MPQLIQTCHGFNQAHITHLAYHAYKTHHTHQAHHRYKTLTISKWKFQNSAWCPHSRLKRISRCSGSSKRNECSALSERKRRLFTLFCGMGSSLQRCSNRIPWILQAPCLQCLQCSQTHHPHHAHHHHEKLTIQRLQPAMERPMAQPGMPFGTRASQMPESRPFQSGWRAQSG